jgi:hypothetical protein
MGARMVEGCAKMWPREVFDIREGETRMLFKSVMGKLEEPGVYVLFRDDHPYYVGKTDRHLFDRIWNHANQPKDRRYNFWNFFSAFVVPTEKHRREVEAILISAMPTAANSASPRLAQIHIPNDAIKKLRDKRLGRHSNVITDK